MATCTVGKCKRKHAARGYCAMHYTRYRRGQLAVDHPLISETTTPGPEAVNYQLTYAPPQGIGFNSIIYDINKATKITVDKVANTITFYMP